MKSVAAALLLLCLDTAAHAQGKFRIGPQVGYTVSSVNFRVADYPDYISTHGSFGSGFEAGVVTQVGLTQHLTLQPSLLFSRYAPGAAIHSYYQPYHYTYDESYYYQLNYLTLPLNLLYSQQPNGGGVQVFAGPYVGWLLGGSYKGSISSGYTNGSLPGASSYAGQVEAGDTYSTNVHDTNIYLRRVDVGVQLGGGYGLKDFQFQASLHYGLRNSGADYPEGRRQDYEAPIIHNYGLVVSAAYLFSFN